MIRFLCDGVVNKLLMNNRLVGAGFVVVEPSEGKGVAVRPIPVSRRKSDPWEMWDFQKISQKILNIHFKLYTTLDKNIANFAWKGANFNICHGTNNFRVAKIFLIILLRPIQVSRRKFDLWETWDFQKN